MNFTPSSFYSKYLQGNEMTDFVEKFIDNYDMDFWPTESKDTYSAVYQWYKVRDIGDNDIIEQALKRCETLPWGNISGCLYIGMTWSRRTSYEDVDIFKDFCKVIDTVLSNNKIDKQIKELQEQNEVLVKKLSINKSNTSHLVNRLDEQDKQNKDLVEELSNIKSFTSHLVNRLDEQDKKIKEFNNNSLIFSSSILALMGMPSDREFPHILPLHSAENIMELQKSARMLSENYILELQNTELEAIPEE